MSSYTVGWCVFVQKGFVGLYTHKAHINALGFVYVFLL